MSTFSATPPGSSKSPTSRVSTWLAAFARSAPSVSHALQSAATSVSAARQLLQQLVNGEAGAADAAVLRAWHDLEKDIDRTAVYGTMPTERQTTALREALLAYAISRPQTGYVQGMGYLALHLVVVYDDDTVQFAKEIESIGGSAAFTLLGLEFICGNVLVDYFDHSMTGLMRDARVLLTVLQEDALDIVDTLAMHEIALEMVVTEWLVCMYTNTATRDAVLELWDDCIRIGPSALMQAAVLCFEAARPLLARAADPGEAIASLVNAARALPSTALWRALQTITPERISDLRLRHKAAERMPATHTLENISDAEVLIAARIELSKTASLLKALHSCCPGTGNYCAPEDDVEHDVAAPALLQAKERLDLAADVLRLDALPSLAGVCQLSSAAPMHMSLSTAALGSGEAALQVARQAVADALGSFARAQKRLSRPSNRLAEVIAHFDQALCVLDTAHKNIPIVFWTNRALGTKTPGCGTSVEAARSRDGSMAPLVRASVLVAKLLLELQPQAAPPVLSRSAWLSAALDAKECATVATAAVYATIARKHSFVSQTVARTAKAAHPSSPSTMKYAITAQSGPSADKRGPLCSSSAQLLERCSAAATFWHNASPRALCAVMAPPTAHALAQTLERTSILLRGVRGDKPAVQGSIGALLRALHILARLADAERARACGVDAALAAINAARRSTDPAAKARLLAIAREHAKTIPDSSRRRWLEQNIGAEEEDKAPGAPERPVWA